MRVSDFDFDLPPERIALRPARPRDAARLLTISEHGALADRRMTELPDLLRPGDIMVFNDTRVISGRLFGARIREGGRVEVQATLLKRRSSSGWTALMKPGKRLRAGDRIEFRRPGSGGAAAPLVAHVLAKDKTGAVDLGFDCEGSTLDHAVADFGCMPLPPYISAQRPEDDQDQDDYQTVYAQETGSVAAPTAGLHMTPDLLERLAAAGIGSAFVTLHVGAGTFLPVKVDKVADHQMHAEVGEISPEAAAAVNRARAAGGRVVCVGTTSLRLLESASDESGVRPFAGETAIFITPGHRFQAADVLLTNFHLPKSTLLMLVAAFGGLETMRRAYAHALREKYRFYSYGDASLWFRRPNG